jgi:hypothetical protein
VAAGRGEDGGEAEATGGHHGSYGCE